jgi:hypothetical protein
MDRKIMFLDCPAYLDDEGAARCGLPAEVQCRFIMDSTDGPVESAMIRCPSGHWFSGPIEFLSYDKAAAGMAQKTGLRAPADRGGTGKTADRGSTGKTAAGRESDGGQGEGHLGSVSHLAGGG